MTVTKLLAAVEQLDDDERSAIAAGVRASALVARLDARAQGRLAKRLRELLNST